MTTPIGAQGDEVSKQLTGFLESVSCAAYIIGNDADLSFIYGNASFFRLFGCTAEDMKHKYGNRLGALISPASLKSLESLLGKHEDVQDLGVKLQIKKNDADVWLYTKVCAWQSKGKQNLFCVSFDITDNERRLKLLNEYEKTAEIVTRQASFDAFEYDMETRKTHMFFTGSVLEQILPSVKRDYTDIMKILSESGAVEPGCVKDWESIFESMGKNEPKAMCEIKVKTLENKIRWVRCTLIVKPESDTGGRHIIGFIEDVTQQKEAYLNYLNVVQFYGVLLNEKSGYAQLDVTDDTITMVGGLWDACKNIIHRKSYSEIVQMFAGATVNEQDREQYCDIMRRENFMDALKNGVNRLGCEFRYILSDNKEVWMELNVHLFKNSFSGHTLALVCIKSIDDQKRLNMLPKAEQTLVNQQYSAVKTQLKRDFCQEFCTLLSNEGDMAYLVDPVTLDLICANGAFYSRMGISEEQCCGKKCYELMHQRETPCPFCGRANWGEDKDYVWKNYNNILAQEFLIKNRLVQWHGKQAMLTFAVDISGSKSVSGTAEDNATESHYVLNGVQGMAAAESLAAVMNSALETIGMFFGSDAVCFWECDSAGKSYGCTHIWAKRKIKPEIKNSDLREIDVWLRSVQAERPVILESPEDMLFYSHSMYQMMKTYNVNNQRWFQLKSGNKELGRISINNICRNFQNNAFLEMFTRFIADEIKKRNLMDDILYAYQRDELTGLLSRNSYEKYLSDYSADCFSTMGVAVANFDQLKEINNNMGFHVGNYCISEFANMLGEVFTDCSLFRLNGDEFLVVAPNIKQEELVDKISELELKIKDDGTFSVSIGCSWDDVERDLVAMIEQATETMKINKQMHHDFVPKAIDSNRRKMLSELVASIENHEFEVFLQPKIEYTNNMLIGAEALIRYRKPNNEYVTPIHFIEKLEIANLIRYIDLFVFEETCKALDSWKKKGIKIPVISVNFSRVTLMEHNILSSIESIMQRYDVEKANIEIEITESVSSMGKSILCQTTNALRNAGFSISLDDFGTKYTNMAILSEIDFDVLKLDKSLINSICCQYSNQVILKSIINMCGELGISVIAEGVETKEQEAVLRELGCMQGQGYLYGKPMPMVDFSKKYYAI